MNYPPSNYWLAINAHKQTAIEFTHAGKLLLLGLSLVQWQLSAMLCLLQLFMQDNVQLDCIPNEVQPIPNDLKNG